MGRRPYITLEQMSSFEEAKRVGGSDFAQAWLDLQAKPKKALRLKCDTPTPVSLVLSQNQIQWLNQYSVEHNLNKQTAVRHLFDALMKSPPPPPVPPVKVLKPYISMTSMGPRVRVWKP